MTDIYHVMKYNLGPVVQINKVIGETWFFLWTLIAMRLVNNV